MTETVVVQSGARAGKLGRREWCVLRAPWWKYVGSAALIYDRCILGFGNVGGAASEQFSHTGVVSSLSSSLDLLANAEKVMIVLI
jgi:hypothetical protein